MQMKMPEYSGPRRLRLQVFVNYLTSDSAPEGARHLYFSFNKKTMWMQDVALDMKGSHWLNLDLANCLFPGEYMKIRFQVGNAKAANDYPTIAVIGPARLVEN
jgi:hypothetical protein